MSIHFSSKTDLWSTPDDFFQILDSEYRFTLDPCSTKENKKCEFHFTKEDDGLSRDWEKHRVFMNPPYGREIKKWMRKASESCSHGALVVCLVPSRTDTEWFHSYAMPYEIRFIKGRLKFGGNKNPAPFPSCLVIMRPEGKLYS